MRVNNKYDNGYSMIFTSQNYTKLQYNAINIDPLTYNQL